MKKIKYHIMWIIVFILGLAILLYPSISDYWNNSVAKSLINDYESTVKNIDVNNIDKMIQEASEYNKSLEGTIVPDAFAYEEANSPNKKYEDLLNPLGNGLLGRIEIPCISVNLPLYHYTTEEVLLKGAGHLPGSSLPIGGESTHTVISAHRGLPSAKMFTDLDRVKQGDTFYIHILDKTLAYEVDLIKVIEPNDTRELSIKTSKDYATLFTCTPYSVNTHRLLVRGHRVDYDENKYQEELNQKADLPINTIILRGLAIIFGLQLAVEIIYLINILKKRKGVDTDE